MRSFLRYLHYKGLVDTDLSLAVPKVARWSFSVSLPKHLAAEQVRQVLQSLRPKHGGGTTQLRHTAFARAAWFAGG